MLVAESVPVIEAMADSIVDFSEEVVEGVKAATVRSARPRLRKEFSRLRRAEEEIERLVVFTAKMSRDLSVTPASDAMRRQTKLARVKPNGTPTQRNRPKPMIARCCNDCWCSCWCWCWCWLIVWMP